ncbi:MAG: hypothetical protein PHF37_02750 [Phycisphaerae bacterium]|nr:hypothetical protein [Phycisphaerae bacterium]
MARVFVVMLALVAGGCSVYNYVMPERAPYVEQIRQSYCHTVLDGSTASDVLMLAHDPNHELLSQSNTVVAWSGQKKEGYMQWFTMAAFSENELTAQRKYLYIMDEKPKVLLKSPAGQLSFDCQMVVDEDVLSEPYADEYARRIAVLKRVHENLGDDLLGITIDNKDFVVAGSVINESIREALVKLKASPVYAKRLDEPKGMEFSTLNLGSGRIRMNIEYNLVTVRIRVGSHSDKIDESVVCPELESVFVE